MEAADFSRGGDFECDAHGADADEAHPFIDVLIPTRSNVGGDLFFEAAYRGSLGGDGGGAAVGDVSSDHGLTGLRLVSFFGTGGARQGRV